MAELSKCGKRVQYIIVHEGRNFLSQNHIHMVHVSLILQGGTEYCMLGNRYFGHLPVARCLPDENVYGILSQGNYALCSFC